jgi:chromosome segregation ATPase
VCLCGTGAEGRAAENTRTAEAAEERASEMAHAAQRAQEATDKAMDSLQAERVKSESLGGQLTDALRRLSQAESSVAELEYNLQSAAVPQHGSRRASRARPSPMCWAVQCT